MSSKEIAPRLGIEPGSVDQHLKAAARVLGVSGRYKAASLLAEAEREGSGPPLVEDGREGPPKLVYHSPRLDAVRDRAIIGSSNEEERTPQRRISDELQEVHSPYEAHIPVRGPALPLPIWGAKPHHLSQGQRLRWILAATIGIALGFGALVSAIETLVRLTAS